MIKTARDLTKRMMSNGSIVVEQSERTVSGGSLDRLNAGSAFRFYDLLEGELQS